MFSNKLGNRETDSHEERFPAQQVPFKQKKPGPPTQLLTNSCLPGTLNQLQSMFRILKIKIYHYHASKDCHVDKSARNEARGLNDAHLGSGVRGLGVQ